MKNLFKLSPLIMFLVSCTRFPYSGVISESKRWIEETHPEYKEKIQLLGKEFELLRYKNSDKPLLIFIHGSPGDWGSFAHFFKDDSLKSQFELISFSRLGFDKANEGIPFGKLSDQIKPIEEIIKRYGIKRDIYLIGHSYGGPVAMKYTLNNPEKIKGLVLVAASMDPELEKMKWYQYIAEAWPIRLLIPNVLDVTNREILALKAELEQMEKEYENFKTPLYVIQGESDVLVPKENVNYIVRMTNVKNTHIKRIKNAKHFIPWAFPNSIKLGVLKLKDE